MGVDASGSRWLKWFRRHVLGGGPANGQVLEVGREPLNGALDTEIPSGKRQLVAQIAQLLRLHADLIGAKRPKSPVNRCGYQLWDVLADDHLDLARLLVGSEGTLALVTEAVLATEVLPRHRGVTLLLFDRTGARAVQKSFPRPSAATVDRRHLKTREKRRSGSTADPREAEAHWSNKRSGM